MYANHYDKRMSGVFHREDSPVADDIPMSPKTRRRTEFITMKQLQNGVLGRARSKLSSFGDVWKPKLSNSKSIDTDTNHRPTSLPLNQRTLDFFMSWSRQKKPSNVADKSQIDALNLMQSDCQPNHKERHLSYSNFFNAAGKQVFGSNNRAKPKLPISPTSRAKIDGKQKTTPSHHNNNSRGMLGKMAPHKSLDIDDLLERDSDYDAMYVNQGRRPTETVNHAICRSFDDNMNYLNEDEEDENGYGQNENHYYAYDGKPQRRRRTWNISLNESMLEGDGFYGASKKSTPSALKPPSRPMANANGEDSREEHAGKESVIRARLKLQKISVNDDLVLNKTGDKMRGILFRHNSMEPNSARDRCQSPSITSSHDSDSSETRREVTRKKITFREPIVLGKYDEIRSDAMDRAKRFLDKYEMRRSSPIPTPTRRLSAEHQQQCNNSNVRRNNEKVEKTGSAEKVSNVECALNADAVNDDKNDKVAFHDVRVHIL